ncbi:hypothetical protein L2E82_22213 [Cichorium intybus]|uniref:Uncharacterized protein n=1 Tax=Cichorium intybus TaxID=13427 RepID=A0ACB9DY58_CICIN|nr:hypothetical protein L2E82_22213 [Cichorium intybus]
MTTVKQEPCDMMRSSEFGEDRSGGGVGGVLWGFPWSIGGGGGDQGNMAHDSNNFSILVLLLLCNYFYCQRSNVASAGSLKVFGHDITELPIVAT